ncbi:MAG: flagellar biosynthetic protein FliR [Gemmatales bacterium]|nr:flagellar biosynthetic protein FliR [Gemmatales bacterium]MDW7995577.1 flagellar biosynthetic protein FliR [Gemmatales bacterium]
MMELAVVGYSLTLARVAVVVGLTPIFGSGQVPRLARIGLAVALAWLWWQIPGDELALQICRRAAENAWWWVLLVGREMLVGFGLALAVRLVLVPARIAGEFVAQEMMLGFAASTSPASEAPGSLLGQLFELSALALFFGLDGHHLVLALMHAGWTYWPVGSWNVLPSVDWLSALRMVMHSGVRLALPVVACLFFLAVALALWSRAAPSLNLFSLGFVVRVLGGLAAMYLFWPVLLVGLNQTMHQVSIWLAGYGR